MMQFFKKVLCEIHPVLPFTLCLLISSSFSTFIALYFNSSIFHLFILQFKSILNRFISPDDDIFSCLWICGYRWDCWLIEIYCMVGNDVRWLCIDKHELKICFFSSSYCVFDLHYNANQWSSLLAFYWSDISLL